ncbi:hypothetical protein ZOSMA_94G00470 [Zostera marina]|uniref:Uncharacterized protein n=1 Tax=Zostera marina TaxID=29655 RepID=A0A0K9NIC7_ZOSMR|nr:hypothetical protein ZOSMA_94G00470 [Zostera marina]
MSKRTGNTARRANDGIGHPFSGTAHQKSRASPLLSVGLILVGAFLLIAYSYRSSFVGERVILKDQGLSCTMEVRQAIPLLKKTYGDSMRKVLHVGPETCTVVSDLFKEDTEAWGIEPYDMEDAESSCKSLLRKGIVRVADIKFSLPYQTKSFTHVIASDALDYLTPKYLNKTLPELARLASDSLIIFAGVPGQPRAKVADPSKFGRPAKLRSPSWWIRYFIQTRLKENEVAAKKFEKAAKLNSYNPGCQIFHLSSNN